MYKSDADCLKNPECSGIKRTDKKYVYFLPVQDYIVLRLKGEL